MMFKELEVLFEKEDIDKFKIVHLIKDFIPNFEHIEKGKNLDQRM